MSGASQIGLKLFNKLFTNIAKDENIEIGKILIGIYFENGSQKYKLYNGGTAVKDIELEDYFNIIDSSTFVPIIGSGIGNAGKTYATQDPVCEVDKVKIILQYSNPENMPNAVLMKDGKKDRNINIEREFFS